MRIVMVILLSAKVVILMEACTPGGWRHQFADLKEYPTPRVVYGHSRVR